MFRYDKNEFQIKLGVRKYTRLKVKFFFNSTITFSFERDVPAQARKMSAFGRKDSKKSVKGLARVESQKRAANSFQAFLPMKIEPSPIGIPNGTALDIFPVREPELRSGGALAPFPPIFFVIHYLSLAREKSAAETGYDRRNGGTIIAMKRRAEGPLKSGLPFRD